MEAITWLGIVAGILTTSSFIPQVIKILRTRETKDISLAMFAILTLGIFLWLIYGFYIGNIPLIMTNLAGFAFSVAIVILKLIYKDIVRS